MVYLAAMAHPVMTTRGSKDGFSIILVEIAYVAITAGAYAGLQQKALGFRSRMLGNLTVVLVVPMLAQLFDWLAHRAAGATVPARATVAVCLFATLSALFHLYVMRRGAFLTGCEGQTLGEDFRRMPRLIAAFVVLPLTYLFPPVNSSTVAESEAAL